jgi:uncharacterized protein (TIGR01777 family)
VNIVIAGGSGFLGRKLTKRLEAGGHHVVTLTRRAADSSRERQWNPDGSPGHLPAILDGCDAVVNLAGEGIADRRWTQARKEAIRRSRVLATRTLVSAIAACAKPPRVFVSASGVGYYGPRDQQPITESAAPGHDFLAGVCLEWEHEAHVVESSATRLAIVRTGLVLDAGGGALAKMLLPFRLGLGARLGTGEQFMSWIHVDDWTAMTAWMIGNDRTSGAFNATAPAPVTNREFTRTLGRVLRRPAVLQAPAFVLHAALGELSAALLTGQRALPAHAEQLGFDFTYRTLEPALRSLNL